MIRFNEVQSQLETSRSPFRSVGVVEVKNLAKILDQGEQIIACLKGWHNGRMGFLCATDKRIIIMSNTGQRCKVYEVTYNDIVDIYHSEKSVTSYITIAAHSYTHVFRAWRSKNVRTVRAELKRHLIYLHETSEDVEDIFDLPRRFAAEQVTSNIAVAAVL